MKLSEEQVKAIKRKRGELNYSVKELSKKTNVSVWTLIHIFKHQHRNVTSITFNKLNNWLIKEYNHEEEVK